MQNIWEESMQSRGHSFVRSWEEMNGRRFEHKKMIAKGERIGGRKLW